MHKIGVFASVLSIGTGVSLIIDGCSSISNCQAPAYPAFLVQDIKSIDSTRNLIDSTLKQENLNLNVFIENARNFVSYQEARPEIISARREYKKTEEKYICSATRNALESSGGLVLSLLGLIGGSVSLLIRDKEYSTSIVAYAS